MTSENFDNTGKVNFDDIYTQDDPRPYFRALAPLDYRIPGEAKPHLRAAIDELRGDDSLTVLDVGCSYGLNAALLRHDLSLEQLYERYTSSTVDSLSRDELLARDRGASPNMLARTRFFGLDISAPALAYAEEAGYLDAGLHADLEAADPSPEVAAQLAQADLVTSTGCLGYVTERTLVRIARARGDRPPVMVHFVLRMFDYPRMAESLVPLGYRTMAVPGLFPQRRFASTREQEQVLATLRAAGVDPTGVEDRGWFVARLFVSAVTGVERLVAVLSRPEMANRTDSGAIA